jgi:hypothetical protein
MNTSGKRDPLDQWWTPAPVARAFARFVISRVGTDSEIIEPACGGGRIVDAFDAEGCPVALASDIEPGPRVERVASFFDVLDLQDTVVATNPPFPAAEKFVEHALRHGAGHVFLLLPWSFRGTDARVASGLWEHCAEIALLHPRVTFDGPARDRKLAEHAAKGTKFADSANGESAIFHWDRQSLPGRCRVIDLPSWRA